MDKKKIIFSSLIMLLIIFAFIAILFFTQNNKYVKVENIYFEQNEITLLNGSTHYSKLNVLPKNANKYTLTYQSSDNNIAQVDKNGKIYAVGVGKATISAYVKESDLTAYLEVTIKEGEFLDIEIDSEIYQTVYYEGDILDLNKLKVTAIYSDGRKENISIEDLELEYPTPLVIDSKLIIKYNGVEKVVELLVLEVDLSKIEIKSLPTKTTYNANEIFSSDGMIIEATYSNGSKKIIDNTLLSYSKEPLSVFDTFVEIEYKNKKIQTAIKVLPNYSVSDISKFNKIIENAPNNSYIKLSNGIYNNVSTITIPLSKNLTIYADNLATLNSTQIIFEFKDIEGGNFELRNINLNSTANILNLSNIKNFNLSLTNTLFNNEITSENDIIKLNLCENGTINIKNSNINKEYIILEECKNINLYF